MEPSSPDIPLSLQSRSMLGLYTIPSRSPSPDSLSSESPGTPTPLSRNRRVLHDEHGVFELSSDFVYESPRRTTADSRRQAWLARREANAESKRQEAEEAKRTTHEIYDNVLDLLGQSQLSLGGLLEYVSDPANSKGNERYYGLFNTVGRVERILDAWASKANSRTGQDAVRKWAVGHVRKLVSSEGDDATKSNFLQTRTMKIDPSFALDFSISSLREELLKYCPVMMDLMRAFSTTPRQEKEMSDASRKSKDNCITTQGLIGLGARSQKNSYAKHVLTLYAYASGAQRQVISVLHHLGLTSSYPSLVGKYRESATLDDLDASPDPAPSTSVCPSSCPATAQPAGPSVDEVRTTPASAQASQLGDSEADVSGECSDDDLWDAVSDIADVPAEDERVQDGLEEDNTETAVEPETSALSDVSPGHRCSGDTVVTVVDGSGEGALPGHANLDCEDLATGSPEVQASEGAASACGRPGDNADSNPAPRAEQSERSTAANVSGTENPPKTGRSGKLHLILAAYGLLKRLSHACRKDARDAARTALLGHVYDNINMLFRVAEQILGRKDSQQNGTCATVFKLFNAKVEDMLTADLMRSLVNAPPLEPKDILFSPQETTDLNERLAHTVLRVIVTYGGERFARFRDDVAQCMPTTADKIPLHQTDIFPLPAMNIDESSTTGNAQVLTEIFSELKQDMASPEFTRTVKLVAGDQLSIARIRSLITSRSGHGSFAQSFLWAICLPGLFHYKMAATHGLLELHYGSPSPSEPGSLSFQNTSLDRKPIVLTSLPAFRVCRDLIFISLYARVLHCLQLVADCASLDEYAAAVDFETLRQHARDIVSKYANADVASRVRRQREREERVRKADAQARLDVDDPNEEGEQPAPPLTSGDAVFENAILFMRDALVLREFTDAIKVGDSGRVVTVLKLWALSFRGSGRTKYAHEMLHLIHNLTHVWPERLRKVVLQNWLVNPTGKKDAWVEVDLMQEHLNFWIKTIYKAHGSSASWEWLAMISPCVNILRHLASRINEDLGSRQGVKHTSPDLEKDISLLVHSLSEQTVYTEQPGRVLDDMKNLASNAVTAGWNQLAGPLADFNTQFARLQQRCLMKPLVGEPYASRASVVRGPPPGAAMASQSTVTDLEPSSPHEGTSVALDGVDAPADSHDMGVTADEEEEEEYYWRDEQFSTTEAVEDSVLFSLDSAEDVALDMDIVDVQYEDDI